MSAYRNLRRANEGLAQAQLYLAAFVGGRDTKNPENDGMLSPSTRLNIDSALYQAEKAVEAMRALMRDIAVKDL